MSKRKNTSGDLLPDSGKREEMPTGSVRDCRDGKGRFDLLPARALARLARHYENGAKKYNERNWEKGQKFSRMLDSGLRHAFAWLACKLATQPTPEDHLAAAVWNLIGIMEFEERGREDLDDLTTKV